MIGKAKRIKAVYSAIGFCWKVKLDDVNFKVTYILVCGKDVRKYKVLIGQHVKWNWKNNVLNIYQWKKLKLKEPQSLYDPDKPRNLAKSVTVK